jgi:hypothetical protein
MRRFAYMVALGFALTACGGGSDADDATAGDSAGTPAAGPATGSTAAVDTMPREIPEGWTMGPLAARENLSRTTPGTRMPVLQLVSAQSLETADRVMLEFSTMGVPAYSAEYVTGPITECGSGKEVKSTGKAWLQLRIQPAQAHSPEGTPTIKDNVADLSGTNVKKVYVTCDFEGQMTLVLALEAKTPFHVSRLEGPTRIVFDIMK